MIKVVQFLNASLKGFPMRFQFIILAIVIGSFSTALFLKQSEVNLLKKDKIDLSDRLTKSNGEKQKLRSELSTAQQANDQLSMSLEALHVDATETLEKKASWCLNRVSEVKAGLAVPPEKIYVQVPVEVQVPNEQVCPSVTSVDVYSLRDLLLAGRKTNSSN